MFLVIYLQYKSWLYIGLGWDFNRNYEGSYFVSPDVFFSRIAIYVINKPQITLKKFSTSEHCSDNVRKYIYIKIKINVICVN